MGQAKRKRATGATPAAREERNVRVMKLIGFNADAIQAIRQRQYALNSERAKRRLPAVSFDEFFGAIIRHGLTRFDELKAQCETEERLVKLPHEVRRTG